MSERRRWLRRFVVIVVAVIVLGFVVAAALTAYLTYSPHGESSTVQAAANISSDESDNSVSVRYVESDDHAEYLNVTFTGWNETATVRLNAYGDTVTVGPHGLDTRGNVTVSRAPDRPPASGDTVDVKVWAVREDVETVIATERITMGNGST